MAFSTFLNYSWLSNKRLQYFLTNKFAGWFVKKCSFQNLNKINFKSSFSMSWIVKYSKVIKTIIVSRFFSSRQLFLKHPDILQSTHQKVFLLNVFSNVPWDDAWIWTPFRTLHIWIFADRLIGRGRSCVAVNDKHLQTIYCKFYTAREEGKDYEP